jgi:hypothetical protein
VEWEKSEFQLLMAILPMRNLRGSQHLIFCPEAIELLEGLVEFLQLPLIKSPRDCMLEIGEA